MAAPVVGVYTCHGKCVDSDPAASAFAAGQQFPDRLPTAYLEIAETHRTQAAHLDDVSHNPFTYACETERNMAEIHQHRHDPPKQEVDALFLPSSGPAGPSMPALIKSLLAAGAALGPLTAVRLVRAVRYLQAHPELTDAEAAGHAALDAADKAALSLLGELTGAPVVRGADGKVVVGSGAAASGAGEPKSTDAAAGQTAQPAGIGLAAGEGVYETTFDNHSNSVSNSIDVNASSQSLQQPLATGEPSSGSAADSDGPAAADSPPAGIDRKPIPSSTAAGVAPRAHAPGAPVDIPCMCPLIPPTLVPEGLHWLAFASAAYKTTRQGVLDVLNGWGQGGSVSGAIPDALLPAGSRSAGVGAVADAAHAAPVTGDPSHISSSGIVGIDAAADNVTPAPAAGGSKVNRLRRPHPHFRDSDLLFARLQPAPLVQAHILVRDRRKRALVLAIRGTATWSDVLADLAAAPLPFSGGSAHTGMAAVVDGLLHYKVDDDGSGGGGGGNDQKHLRAAGAVPGNVLRSSVAQGGAGTRGAVGVGGRLQPVAEEAGNVSNGAPASPRAAAMATSPPPKSSSTTAPSSSAQPAASSSSSGGVDQTYSCPLARAFAEARIAASRRVRTATIASASRSMEGGEDREGTGQLAAAASPAATALPHVGLGGDAAAIRDSTGTALHQARPAAALPSRTPSTYTETEASAPEDVELQRDSAFCSRIPDLETKGFGGIAVILQRAIRAHPGYRVIVTGHSLGAGVAALLTLKLVRIVQFLRQESDRRLNTAVRSTTGGNHAGGAADGEHSGEAPGQAPGEATGTSSTASSTPSWSDDTLLPELPAPQIMPRPVHCWAFAVPACMSPELAAWTTLSAADTGAAVAGSIPPSLRDAPWAKQIEEQLRKGRRSGNGNSTRSSEWDRDQTLDPLPPVSSSSSRSLSSSSSASLPTGEATAEDDADDGGEVGKASDSSTTAGRSSSKRSSTTTTASWSELRRCPLITSIVLGDDVVPRLTLMSVKALASAVDSMPLSAALASLPLDIAATCVALPTCGVLTAVQAVMDAFVASVKALRPGGQARALGGAHSGAAAGGVVPGQGAAAAVHGAREQAHAASVQSREAAKADASAIKTGMAGESHSYGDAGAGGAANAEQAQLPLPALSTDLPNTNANNPFNITIAAGEGVFVTMDAADTATTDVVQQMQRLEGHSIVMEPFAAAARGAAAESRGEIPVGAQPSIEEDGWTQFMCPKATMEAQSKCRQARSYFCKTGFVGKLRAAHIPEPVIIALLHMIEPGWAHPSQELVVPGRIYHLHLPPHRDPVPTAQAAADTATAASDGVSDTGYPAAGAPGAVAAGLESAAAASTGDGSAIGPLAGAATAGAALAPSLPSAASAGSLHRMVPAHLSSIRVSPTMGSDHHKVSYVTALKARLQCCEGNWVPF